MKNIYIASDHAGFNLKESIKKKYSKKYLSAEREAKREELGLWKGTFDMPWDWRKNVKK